MRVPKAGQDLIERRIVREGKRLAALMLADYRDPPRFSVPSVVAASVATLQRVGVRLRDLQIRL